MSYLPTMQQWESWFTYSSDSPLLFNSGLFLGLFIAFYAGYILLRKKFRIRLLYVAAFSIFFYYKTSGIFFLLLIGTTILDFILANILYKESRKNMRILYLTISIVSNLGILAYFKYTDFIIVSLNSLTGTDFKLQGIFLPVGISFFTFQSISYIIEIYRKEIEPARNYLDYVFYISFFPQLVAGPIVRAKDFIPQIYSKLCLTEAQVNEGLLLIVGGLIKKAVISDYISVSFVDRVFATPDLYSPLENLLATYGYAIQIYCDFSGYSDMAIGLALLLGFRLPMNFNVPYQSASITEFWRRWHISLSTWLKDFLYISTGGNRNGSIAGYLFPSIFFIGILWWGISYWDRSHIPLYIAGGSTLAFVAIIVFARKKQKALFTNFNLMTTMLLGGLWHGAALKFIIWGALHGLALAVHKFYLTMLPQMSNTSPWAKRIWHGISVIVTFHFVSFCWIFFRAKDFSVALNIIRNISDLSLAIDKWMAIFAGYRYVFLLITIAFIWHFLPQKWIKTMQKSFDRLPLVGKAAFVGLSFWLVIAVATTGPQPFIYFQF